MGVQRSSKLVNQAVVKTVPKVKLKQHSPVFPLWSSPRVREDGHVTTHVVAQTTPQIYNLRLHAGPAWHRSLQLAMETVEPFGAYDDDLQVRYHCCDYGVFGLNPLLVLILNQYQYINGVNLEIIAPCSSNSW